jgi:hypothetical protein
MKVTSKRLVLHIGPHKTATSYIQENLKATRSVLASHGWSYPEDPVDERAGHHHLAQNRRDYLSKDAANHALLLAWAAEAQQHACNLVLSSEGFCRWGTDDFDRLAGTLGYDCYELVYTIRNPLDVFPSLWAEEVKHGRTLGFADRFAREFSDPYTSRVLFPYRDLEPLLVHDRVKLHVMPYDVLVSRDAGLFTHMAEVVLGVPSLAPLLNDKVNQQYDIEITEFLRLMTLIHGDGAARIGPDLRLRFTSEFTSSDRKEIISLMRKAVSFPLKTGPLNWPRERDWTWRGSDTQTKTC